MVAPPGCEACATTVERHLKLPSDAIAHVTPLLSHKDGRTVEDALAAIDAIESRNHHYFVDRDHSGRVHWCVNDDDG